MSRYYINTATLLDGTIAMAADVEAELDAVDAGLDLVEGEMDETIRFSNADYPGGVFADNAANRASKVIGFDASGNPALLTAGARWTGNHAGATYYRVNDIAKDAAGQVGLNNIYICTTAHTSTGPADLSADIANWQLMIDVVDVNNSEAAAAASAAAALVSEGNAATSESNAGISEGNAGTSETNAAVAAAAADAARLAAESALASATGWQRKTAAYTMVAGDKIMGDVTGGVFTLTLPATPAEEDTVMIVSKGATGANLLTVDRNGSTMDGLAEDFEFDVDVEVTFKYLNASWRPH